MLKNKQFLEFARRKIKMVTDRKRQELEDLVKSERRGIKKAIVKIALTGACALAYIPGGYILTNYIVNQSNVNSRCMEGIYAIAGAISALPLALPWGIYLGIRINEIRDRKEAIEGCEKKLSLSS